MRTVAGVGQVRYADHDNDPTAIAEAAVTDALEPLDGSPDFAFVFASKQIVIDALAESLDQRLDCEWVGCTTAGELSSAGRTHDGCVVIAISSEDIWFKSAVTTGIRDDTVHRSATTASEFSGAEALIALFPGYTEEEPTIEAAVLRGIQQSLGVDIPICGGAAADGDRFRGTLQFRNGDVYTNALVLAGIWTDHPITTTLVHGYHPTEHRFDAGVRNGEIETLDGDPAQDVYARHMGVAPAELEGSVQTEKGIEMPALLAQYAHRHPFGIETDGGYSLVVPEAAINGAITISQTIEDGAELVLMEYAADGASEDAAAEIRNLFEDDAIAFGLVFDCAGRDLAFDTEPEVTALQDALDGPFAGFFSYGELGGHEDEASRAHYLTMTALLVRSK